MRKRLLASQRPARWMCRYVHVCVCVCVGVLVCACVCVCVSPYVLDWSVSLCSRSAVSHTLCDQQVFGDAPPATTIATRSTSADKGSDSKQPESKEQLPAGDRGLKAGKPGWQGQLELALRPLQALRDLQPARAKAYVYAS